MRGATFNELIMQVLGCKRIASTSEKERYRLLLSDGKYVISFAMLTQVGEIPTFTIIKVNKYITSIVNSSGKSER